MNRLYLRIYVAVLSVLALVTVLAWIVWHSTEDADRAAAVGTLAEMVAEVFPPATASRETQEAALKHWGGRMHTELSLYGDGGELIASVGDVLPPPGAARTESGWMHERLSIFALKLPDGRWLVTHVPNAGPRGPLRIAGVLALIAVAVAIGAYPVVRRLTRRLEHLQSSVEALGAGELSARVRVEGSDEVAHLGDSFNRAAERIEALMAAQKALLANASHELRSPLARIRMAVELMESGDRTDASQELRTNIVELDQLIDEILLASRLEAGAAENGASFESLDFTALVAEECARVGAGLSSHAAEIMGDPRLIRRLVRNLLENAHRHGGGSPIDVALTLPDARHVELAVCDRGGGVPEAERERIFEPFFRARGTREGDGGVGLGLSLVRAIARKHGGEARCAARSGGGTSFTVFLKRSPSLP